MKRKRWLIPVLLFVMALCLMVRPVMAEQYLVNDRPLNLFAYITQGASYNLSGSDYYNEEGFNSALMNLFMEGDYELTDNLRIYAATMLTTDWMYEIKDSDNSWENKLFDKSDNQEIDDEYWQILKEIHLTWTAENFYFRVGKQIVSWGEMDGERIMDQINPLDQSRGPADVEFETSVIPFWLLRTEYNPLIDSPWLHDFAIEFVLNPNADFIPNKGLGPGTDKFGIWAPEIYIPMGGPAPFDYMYMGSMVTNIDDPDEWDFDEFEYGLRIKALISDWIITLNGFYGRENTPVTKMAPVMPIMGMAYDGRMIMHPVMQGRYPRQKFVGLTINHDFSSLKTSVLGGVSPVMRLEALYQFDKTYTTNRNPWGMGEFEEFDRLRFGIGFDWKIKHKFIPHSLVSGISVSPQILYSKIMDYPSYGMFGGQEKESFAYTLMLMTNYCHARIVPMVFWWHDHDTDADFLQLKLTYTPSNKWLFTVGSNFFNGREVGTGFEVFDNKDHLFFKISYKLG